MTIVTAHPDGTLHHEGKSLRCAIGRSGFTREKREGDGASPIGSWPMLELFYRPDRLAPPRTRLPLHPLETEDGWCDDPDSLDYNRQVKLPFPASHERMWRDDGLYDLVVVLGYNLPRPVPGLGSAIFLHVARPDYGPTEGCVALARPDLLDLVSRCGPDSRLVIGS